MIHCICVAYERPLRLEILIRSFIVQTSSRWMLHIVYDGPVPEKITDIVQPLMSDGRIRFYQSEERNQKYGHPNRRMMLQKIETKKGDFILMTNDDNYYVPKFVEYFLKSIKPNVGMIYCNTLRNFEYEVHNSVIGSGGIDMGAFIVREDIAKKTGFNYDTVCADGIYAHQCNEACKKEKLIAVKIEKPLFIHN